MNSTTKIRKISELENLCRELKEHGKKIVYTSGVFDLLHIGHLRYLEAARALGDTLVVGVNSDASVHQLKGPLRPIVHEAQRAELIAGLSCVDYVFVFSDKNNNNNVQAIKPDIYAKAGDYDKNKLSSAALVESWGGRVELIKFEDGFSSTELITRIASRYGGSFTETAPAPQKPMQPAVFIDRDGTINQHVDFLSDPAQFELIPGVLEGLKKLKDAGFYLVITTNQPGIGLGYFTREDLYAVNRKFLKLLSAAGITLDKFYFCPHSEAEGCTCRKPGVGMIERACRELPIQLEHSFVVGDTTIDLQFASNAGIHSILVETGLGGKDGRFGVQPGRKVRDLSEAADFIVANKPK